MPSACGSKPRRLARVIRSEAEDPAGGILFRRCSEEGFPQNLFCGIGMAAMIEKRSPVFTNN